MSQTLTLGRSKIAAPDAGKTRDPLPADPQGQQLCKIFGNYLYCSIYADTPEDITKKPQWHTQRRYKLKNRVLYRDWQDAEKLIGVRPGHTISYALLDIDINSPYHPRQDSNAIARIEATLETIGITRTIRIRSSWSEGLHLYMPLPELVKTFDLAVALKNCLEPQGFQLKQGQLECFPNVKAYGNIIKTEYLAHRLPMQPGSGSCLLDESLNPASNTLHDFLRLWEIAAARQDISTLRQALPLARKNRYKKVRNRLNKVDSWKKDLETVLAEGWSGPGQTNQLLKEFGCYGHVFLGYYGEELVDFIHQQAISSAGYQQWCRHQREIKMRSRVWATAVEKYYWPIGTYKDVKKPVNGATNTIVPFNNLRAQNATDSIKTAVEHLVSKQALPEKATARALAIRETQTDLGTSSSSLETLYKTDNKKLWHPDFYSTDPQSTSNTPPVIDEASSLSGIKDLVVDKSSEKLKPSEDKELRTKGEIMKCYSSEGDVLPSAKTKFYSGKGGLGGEKSFPQEGIHTGTELLAESVSPSSKALSDLRISNDNSVCEPRLNPISEKEKLQKRIKKPILKRRKPSHVRTTQNTTGSISQEVNETIQMIQITLQKLCWSIDQVNAFIAQKFQGRRRAQLADTELMDLLYYLQTQYLANLGASIQN